MLENRLIGITLFPDEQMKVEEIERLPVIKAYQTGKKGEETYKFIDLEVFDIALKELLKADVLTPTTIFLALEVISRKPRRATPRRRKTHWVARGSRGGAI